MTTTLLGVDALSVAPDILSVHARLTAEDVNVREAALLELAACEDEAFIPIFVAALRSDVAVLIRVHAAHALAAWEDKDAVRALCAALTDDAKDVREAAAYGLLQLKEPNLGELLLPWLQHEAVFVRTSVERVLRQLKLENATESGLNVPIGHIPTQTPHLLERDLLEG